MLIHIATKCKKKIRHEHAVSVAGIVAGSIIKFLILSAAVNLIVSVPEPVARAMQLPQLLNALIGGVMALIVERAIRATLNSSNSYSF